MKRYTNYYTAAHWLSNSLILCNDIEGRDESVLNNCRFSIFNEEDETEVEIYQYFLTDCSESDVEWLEKSFGLLFTYSDMLDLYILCVDHYGTLWASVPCQCLNDDIRDDTLISASKDGYYHVGDKRQD